MTSVPLPYVDNLSSLAWIGVCLFLLVGSYLNEIQLFNFPWKEIVCWAIIICVGIFIADQLILGPIWHMKKER
jgi:hypothetical protein